MDAARADVIRKAIEELEKVKKKYIEKETRKSDKVIKKYAKGGCIWHFRKIYRTGPEGIDIPQEEAQVWAIITWERSICSWVS